MIHLVHLALAYGLCALGGCGEEEGPVIRTDVSSGTQGPAAAVNERDNLRYLGRYEGPDFVEIQDIETDGRFAWMCTAVQGLMKYDLASPDRPAFEYAVGSSAGSSRYPRCFRLALAPGRVYMSSRGDEIQPDAFVATFDVRGARPSERGVWIRGEAGSVEGLDWSDGRLYVAAQSDGLIALDAPDDGSLTWRLALTQGLSGPRQVRIDAARKLALVADGAGGLKVIDLSDPEALVLLGGATTQGQAVDLDLHAPGPDQPAIAYVAAASGGLEIFDYSDPAAPKRLSATLTPGTALGVSVSDGHAFVAAWNDLRAFDLADLTAPKLVAVERVWSPDAYPRVMAVGSHGDLVLAGEWAGLITHRFVPGLASAHLTIQARVVDFGRLHPGVEVAQAIVFANVGAAPLKLAGATVEPEGVFTVHGAEPRVLDPGQESFVEVCAVAPDNGRLSGRLILRTDDPDEPELEIQLRGNSGGYDIGDRAPTFEMPDLDGTIWTSRGLKRDGKVVLLAYFATF